jgi:hypothetical protein
LSEALSWTVMATPGSKRTQAAEEIHNLLRIAVAHRRPIAAVYKEFNRLLCPHRLGWNKEGGPRVLSYQYGGESETGLGPPGAKENWRCMALDKIREVELLDGLWHTAENHSRPAHCIERVEIDVDDQPERD